MIRALIHAAHQLELGGELVRRILEIAALLRVARLHRDDRISIGSASSTPQVC